MSERTEIIKTLAEKVMGWKRHCRNSAFYVPAEYADKLMDENYKPVVADDFDPFTNSADNDALVEAFLQDDRWDIVINTTSRLVEVVDDDWSRTSERWLGTFTPAKKNEAVCMAIYQAIKETKCDT